MAPKREEWYVEVIVEAKRTGVPHLKDKENLISPAWIYRVKWAGFPDEENTWEPVKNLGPTCKRLIKSLWAELGHATFRTNAKDVIFYPSAAWISREKIYFAENVPVDAVAAQNQNPKKHMRSRSRSESGSRTPTPSPSIPRQNSRSPRKNTAQWNSATRQRIAEASDSEDEIPDDASANAHPTRGRSTHRRVGKSSRNNAENDPENDPDDDVPIALLAGTSPTGGPRLKLHGPRLMQPSPESTKHIPQTRDTPSPPPPGRNPLFSPPPSWPSHSIKIFDTAVSPGSKLTTKQRLARATVAPALPRESPVKNAVPPQPAAASDDAMDIDVSPTLVPNDTANTADGDVTHEISPMLALMHTEDDLPHGAGGTGLYRSDEDPYASLPKNGDSIDSMDVDMDFGGGDGAEPFDAGDGPYMNAEAFLNTVQIPAPSKPPNPDYRPTQPVRPPAPVPQWSWNGKLTITVRDAVQTVCEHVTLTDATAPTVPNKPRINSFVKLTSKELNFPVFYGAHDLQMVLPACQPVQQFARLTAAGPDADSFELLARYMAREGQVVVLPAVWDDDEVIGYLMVFAPTALAGVLDVPPNLSTPDCLIVALVYKTEKVPPLRRHHKRFPYLAPALPSRDQWLKSLRDDKMYHISLRIVKLPPLIQEFAYKHASVVWFERAPGDEQDKDTEHLLRVLKKSKAGVVSPRDPAAELVFVHVAALKNVHNLPLLAQRRLRPDVWFCSYGTCATEPLSRWGTREIYQLGGVVTFTPEALVRDAWGVLKTIRNIHAHPLWICYLLPQVIGMALRLYEEDESMQDYRGSLPLALDRIFDAIVDGKVALVCAPPVNGSKEEWTLAHGIFAPRTKNVMLEHCLKSFEDAYASSMQSDWGTLAHNDLLEDMRRMQVQPAISDLYRRFVVLDAGPDILMHDGEDGIEWFAIGNFDFNDDYMKSASEQPSS